MFICPGSKYGNRPDPDYPGALYREANHLLNATNLEGSCSYLYAAGLNLQTHPETVIMADAPVGPSGSGYGWRMYIRHDNHGIDGLNALYVDGRAQFISMTHVSGSGSGAGRWHFVRRTDFLFSPYQGNDIVDTAPTRLMLLSPKFW